MKPPFLLAMLAVALLAGCTSQSVKAVRVVDNFGAPLANATLSLTYSVPYTVCIWKAGPTDKNGYAALHGRYKIEKTSAITVMTADEVISFDYARFGTIHNEVLTLSTWRGVKSEMPEAKGPDTLRVPSVYLSKGANSP